MTPLPDSADRRAAQHRICVVGINYVPEPTGIGPYTSFMAEAIGTTVAEVHVVTGVPHYPAWSVAPEYRGERTWHETSNGVEITRVRHFVPSVNSVRGRARMESSFLAAATPEVRRMDADGVIAITPSIAGLGAAIAGRKRRPVGVVVQDLTGAGASQSGTTGDRAARGIASLERWLLSRVDLVGVITPGFIPEVEAAGIAPDRIVELPNFSRVKPVEIPREEARRHLRLDPDRYLVVHTGNMGMKQGLDVIAETARLAASSMPDLDLLLVGDGNQRSSIEEQTSGLSNVTMLPPFDDDSFPYVLAAADQLLLCERDGVANMALPSKLTAYTAARRPIIAAVMADGLSARAINEAGVGHVVRPSDPVALLEGIRHLRVSTDVCADMIDNQITAFDALRPERAAERYQAFAARLLALR
jgi:colanic acid biosynthesis glycosyl transferase WcaI